MCFEIVPHVCQQHGAQADGFFSCNPKSVECICECGPPMLVGAEAMYDGVASGLVACVDVGVCLPEPSSDAVECMMVGCEFLSCVIECSFEESDGEIGFVVACFPMQIVNGAEGVFVDGCVFAV